MDSQKPIDLTLIKDLVSAYDFPSLNETQYRFQYTLDDISSLEIVLKSELVWRNNSEGIERLLQSFKNNILNSNYLIPVSSCTSGLFCAISYYIQKTQNKFVIVPAYTWHSVATSVINAGGIPIFWDVSFDSLKLSKAIPNFNKADVACVIISHLFGIPGISDECIKYLVDENINIIEDCAQCIKGVVGNKSVGQIGNVSVYSFNGSKHIPVGEGGIIVTNDKDIYKFCDNFIMNVYDSKSLSINRFNHGSSGWNFRLSAIQASLASSLMNRIESDYDCSCLFYKNINILLQNCHAIKIIDYNSSYYYLGFPVLVNNYHSKSINISTRDLVFGLLKYLGVEVSVWMSAPVPMTNKFIEFNRQHTFSIEAGLFSNALYLANNHIVFKEIKNLNQNHITTVEDILKKIGTVVDDHYDKT